MFSVCMCMRSQHQHTFAKYTACIKMSKEYSASKFTRYCTYSNICPSSLHTYFSLCFLDNVCTLHPLEKLKSAMSFKIARTHTANYI
uniref:Uncharacterized protein n=1 Tax=Otus sunia TaxID=257818 RepID=A0A8C8BDH1_9STRI